MLNTAYLSRDRQIKAGVLHFLIYLTQAPNSNKGTRPLPCSFHISHLMRSIMKTKEPSVDQKTDIDLSGGTESIVRISLTVESLVCINIMDRNGKQSVGRAKCRRCESLVTGDYDA